MSPSLSGLLRGIFLPKAYGVILAVVDKRMALHNPSIRVLGHLIKGLIKDVARLVLASEDRQYILYRPNLSVLWDADSKMRQTGDFYLAGQHCLVETRDLRKVFFPPELPHRHIGLYHSKCGRIGFLYRDRWE